MFAANNLNVLTWLSWFLEDKFRVWILLSKQIG